MLTCIHRGLHSLFLRKRVHIFTIPRCTLTWATTLTNFFAERRYMLPRYRLGYVVNHYLLCGPFRFVYNILRVLRSMLHAVFHLYQFLRITSVWRVIMKIYLLSTYWLTDLLTSDGLVTHVGWSRSCGRRRGFHTAAGHALPAPIYRSSPSSTPRSSSTQSPRRRPI